jgi:hypothetical protein
MAPKISEIPPKISYFQRVFTYESCLDSPSVGIHLGICTFLLGSLNFLSTTIEFTFKTLLYRRRMWTRRLF